jgi:hypothetical protein
MVRPEIAGEGREMGRAGALAIALLLVGCGFRTEGPTLIVMQNKKTGQMAQCESDDLYRKMAVEKVEACAKSYEKAGWVRIDPNSGAAPAN